MSKPFLLQNLDRSFVSVKYIYLLPSIHLRLLNKIFQPNQSPYRVLFLIPLCSNNKIALLHPRYRHQVHYKNNLLPSAFLDSSIQLFAQQFVDNKNHQKSDKPSYIIRLIGHYHTAFSQNGEPSIRHQRNSEKNRLQFDQIFRLAPSYLG